MAVFLIQVPMAAKVAPKTRWTTQTSSLPCIMVARLRIFMVASAVKTCATVDAHFGKFFPLKLKIIISQSSPVIHVVYFDRTNEICYFLAELTLIPYLK